MLNEQTLWDLVSTERIAIEDLSIAVEAYLADPTSREHRIGPCYTLDLATAVAAYASNGGASELIDPHAPSRRRAVRSALLMAKPKRF